MVKFYFKRSFYLSFISGVFFLFLSYYLDKVKETNNIENANAVKKARFEKVMNRQIALLTSTKESFNYLFQKEKFNPENGLSVQLYKRDSLFFWSNNSIAQLSKTELLNPLAIKFLRNGIFLTSVRQKNDTAMVLFYLIRNDFEITNAYLVNTLNPDFETTEYCAISEHAADGYSQVDLAQGISCFIKFDIQQGYSTPALWFFFIGLILLCIGLKYILDDVFAFDFVAGLTILYAAAIGLQSQLTIHRIPRFIYLSEIFNPSYFASSEYLPSFGDLVSIVILFSICTAVSVYYLSSIKVTSNLKALQTVTMLLLFYILNAAYFTIITIHNLVIDSKISFDLSNAFDLSWFSLAGVLVIILMYIITIHLSHIFSKLYGKVKPSFFNLFSMIFVVFAWILLLNGVLKDELHISKIAITFIFLLSLVIAKWTFGLKSFIVRHLTYALIFVIFAAYSFYKDLNEKAETDSASYANRLTTQIDYKAEEVLNAKEKVISNDTILLNQCFKSSFDNDKITQYLKLFYINNYLDKFDFNAYLFSQDTSFNQKSTYSVSYFDTLFSVQGLPGLSNNFRFVKSPAEFFGYIGKFEFYNKGERALLYLVLKLQPYQDDNLLPILLAGKNTTFKRSQLDYSYAIYNRNKLMQQAGSYAYQTKNNFENIDPGNKIIYRDGLSHLLHKDSEELLVVVSSRQPTVLAVFANALSLYIIVLLVGGFIIIGAFIFRVVFRTTEVKGIRTKLNQAWRDNLVYYDLTNFRFSSRIIINILELVLFIFTVTTFFTIYYINNKINEEAKTQLINKLKSINKYIAEEKFLQEGTSSNEAEAELIKASSLFSTDINIYDSRGKLFLTSKPEIFREGLLTDRIKYFAYSEILNEKASLYTENETIGALKYTSYYQPYFDRNRNMMYIINTPYFTRSIEHNAQISAFIVNFLNLYVAFLIVMFLIAYFVAQQTTQPFILLRDKLKSLRLDRENELLEWHRHDEIGELIKQYNSMVIDLKESKENLANAERTEAWREMAKQVAHDIKNPLTPMKLNLQYLQKAIEAGDPLLNQKFMSVSRSLITQIDALSEMANKFSNFAKVPEASPIKLNLAEELATLTSLYKASDFVEIKFDTFIKNTYVWMDKVHFSRAVGNVIKNAIQAIPQGREGKVVVAFQVNDGYAIITITDNGEGISKEMEPLVFIPNFSTKSSGTGIGLSITKSLIENAGGTVSFNSEKESGTTFIIRIPLFQYH